MRTVALHLDAGSDVRRTLEALARSENATGFVLSVVGNLAQAAFQCPGKPQPTLLHGELEIITLQGTLSPAGVHLHLSFSDGECQVWGGHLEPGTVVHKGADVLVGFLDAAGPADQPGVSAQVGFTASPAAPVPAPGEPRLAIAVRPGCPYCHRALRLLRTLGIPTAVVDDHAEGRVPQIWIDGTLIGGYDALVERYSRGDLEPLRER